ncbi:MAG: CapA family protein [Bacteroidales bacterium]|nr:CapA family protein [Bacteroidales bacterium]MBS3776122.1 CapA family protein [Bacteroidales bacterium]
MLPKLIIILTGILLLPGSSVIQELAEPSINIPVFHSSSSAITLFLCGDVMTGRGVDQIFPQSVDPRIYESYVKDARDYVRLAEQEKGSIDKPVSYDYIWGDAQEVWEQINPTFKIINLETSITAHDEPWPGKGIHYRMHPGNTKVLTEAGIDFCSLANNHIMDWGREGLLETLKNLENKGIQYAGAGKNLKDARKLAVLNNEEQRVIVLAYGSPTSGLLQNWKATSEQSGVNLLSHLDTSSLKRIKQDVQSTKQPGDIVVFSIHWGDNWGYEIPARQRKFAHRLIDEADVDVIHGHSSHHPRGIEVYKNKLILYGAGDFINDYEGISGHNQYRDDLTLMYFPKIHPENGNLISMKIVPMQIRNLRLNHVSGKDAEWLSSMLNREGKKLGTSVVLNQDNTFSLHWE